MITTLLSLLNEDKDIDDWKIKCENIKSTELFLIKDIIEMNRYKEIDKYQLTIYCDYNENNIKYRSFSSCNIDNSMNKSELKVVIEGLKKQLKYSKNLYFPLPINDTTSPNFQSINHNDFIDKILKELIYTDFDHYSYLNSTEIYINTTKHLVLNSKGIDVSYYTNEVIIEYVITCVSANDEIELNGNIKLSNYIQGEINNILKNKYEITYLKSIATQYDGPNNIDIILKDTAVKDIFKSYAFLVNASNIYNKLTYLPIGSYLFNQGNTSDKLSISIDPILINSSKSRLYDDDGLLLKPITIIKNNQIKNYYGDSRYSYYLNLKPTGNLTNLVVSNGNNSILNLRNNNYIEIEDYANLQIDYFSGYFSIDIRLGLYCNDEIKKPITNCSVTGFINGQFQYSKELVHLNDYYGPKYFKIFDTMIQSESI